MDFVFSRCPISRLKIYNMKRMVYEMIQDIAPHKYDNAFSDRKPEPDDYVLLIHSNSALLINREAKAQEGNGNRENQEVLLDQAVLFEIPMFSELTATVPDALERAVYLFSIDEKPYFLLEKKEGEEIEGNGCLEWKGTQYFRMMEPMFQAFAAITATQVWRWRESRKFCGHCGARTIDSKTERALVCPVCGQIEYPKISPAVIVAVTNGDKLLMSKYRGRTYRGYALIAGFVEIGETFEETVHREVMEEVGLKVKNIRYFKSQPWAFTDTEMIGFYAELDGDDSIRLQEDELAEAGWYTREEIPDDEVLISVGSEMKMAFKYGDDWMEKLGTVKGAGEKVENRQSARA